MLMDLRKMSANTSWAFIYQLEALTHFSNDGWVWARLHQALSFLDMKRQREDDHCQKLVFVMSSRKVDFQLVSRNCDLHSAKVAGMPLAGIPLPAGCMSIDVQDCLL